MFYPRPKKDDKVDETIIKHTKKHSNTIHGAKAVNIHLPEELRRPTSDWDIWSNKPQQHQDSLEKDLDKMAGYDAFHKSEIELSGSAQGMVYRVVSNFDGKEVADFMKTPKGAKYKRVSGVRYETLEHAKKVYKEILNDPYMNYQRKQKTQRDLERILAFERKLGKGQDIRESEVPTMFTLVRFKPASFGTPTWR